MTAYDKKIKPMPDVSHPSALAYLVAVSLGLGVAFYMFPFHLIFATDALIHPVRGDIAVHVIGQRYYVLDSWRWPLLLAKPLVVPDGTSVAFTDSIPLLAILMKVVRHFLPAGFHSIFLWLALCWIFQPLAAVFALRSTGERRLGPSLAVAIIAISMPTLLNRVGHSALCSHFLILIAIGLYFYIVRQPRISLIVAAGVLMISSLLVNPYIMYMVVAVLCAAPVSLLIRKEKAGLPVAIGITAAIAASGGIALLLGYGGALPMPGFGYYSMNLLSPLYPTGSAIFPGLNSAMDATGGQYEGYQYLGLGIILLLVIADFSFGRSDKIALLRRHAGVVIVCVLLTLLALSTTIYAGHYLLVQLEAPSFLLQFRVTGRFFWPVAYLLVIAGISIVCRSFGARVATVVLLLLASIQFAETGTMRRMVRQTFHSTEDWVVNVKELRPLVAQHATLIVLPKFLCGADQFSAPFAQVFLLASEVGVPVNTMYVSRFTKLPECDVPSPLTVKSTDLVILLPERRAGTLLSIVNWRDICRQLGPLVVCSEKLRGRQDLSTPEVPTLPTAKDLFMGTNGEGVQALGSGWSVPEPWGVWSRGSGAQLVVRVSASSSEPLLLRVWAHALAFPPDTSQEVTVAANGRQVAVWHIKNTGVSEYDALVPPPQTPDQPLLVDFHIGHPVAPRQIGLGPDDREVGIGLTRFRFDPQPD